jgi:hypothetical protein
LRNRTSVSAPKSDRSSAINAGENDSRASAMKMNDEPHINAMTASKPQSAGVNPVAELSSVGATGTVGAWVTWAIGVV